MSHHDQKRTQTTTRILWWSGLISLSIGAAAAWVAFDLDGRRPGDAQAQPMPRSVAAAPPALVAAPAAVVAEPAATRDQPAEEQPPTF